MNATPSDQIYPLTRFVAAIVIPFLLLAFVILYFFPEQSGERFAWTIKPNMMAKFIAAGYFGGAYLFVRVVTAGRWHWVAPGFLPVTAFTISMLLATLLHWNRFDVSHFPFQLWLGLYVVTPIVVPCLWLWNRREDRGQPESGDKVVPAAARSGMIVVGAVIGLFALLGFISPATLIELWVWPLTPLTARILGGWFALLAVGGLTIGRESHWSSWKVGIVSIGIWHTLVLMAAVYSPDDFPGGVVNWYTVLVGLGLAGMAGLSLFMSMKRPNLQSRLGQ